MRKWLQNIRKEKRMTQEATAILAGISRAYYTNIENGIRGEALPVETAKKIATALDFDWIKFYEDENEETASS